MRKNTYGEYLTLREFRAPVISVECVPCQRRTDFDRKALVRQFGASTSFMQLRRRLAVGCNRMQADDGTDQCQTRFPCLVEAGLSMKKEDRP